MEGKDNIKELFSQKLGNYEAPVNPELWANISSQVAAGAAATTATGLSVLAKVAIGVGVSVAAITTVVLLTSSPDEIVSEEPTKEVNVQQETPTSTTTNKQEQVAEVSDEKMTSPEGFRDVTNYLGESSSNKETSETSSDLTPNDQKITTTPNPEPLIGAMPTRKTTTIIGDKTSEPTIVEGVTYGTLTNYGTAPTNAPDPEQLETANTPKVEPIKRYVNVFTPNGDGRNDYFELESEGLTDFSVVVFNPSGDVVFQSNDPTFRWDGRDRRTGEMVESGNYMYMVSAYDTEGKPFPIYERLMIQR